MQGVLKELEKNHEKPPKIANKADLQKRKKRLQAQKDKYQEMYAADVMTMQELKEKMNYVNKEIDDLNEQLNRINASDTSKEISIEQARIYTKEIDDFLALENVTNGDLKKIISRIIVNRMGEIKIYLRNFSDFMTA